MFPATHANRKTKRGKRINPPNPQSSTQYLLQLHQVTLLPKSSADIPLDTTWAPGLGKPLLFGQPALLVWTFNGKQNVIDYAVIWDIRSWIQWQAFPVLHLQYQTSPAIIIHSFNLHSLLSTLQVIPATGVVKQNWKSYKKMTVKDKYQLGITSTWGIIRSQGFSAWSRYSGICQYTHRAFSCFPTCLLTGTVTICGENQHDKTQCTAGESDGYSQNLYIYFATHSFPSSIHSHSHTSRFPTSIWGKTIWVQHQGWRLPAIKASPHLWHYSCLTMVN